MVIIVPGKVDMKRHAITSVLFVVLTMFIIQVAFMFLQRIDAEKIANVVAAMLQNEENVLKPAKVTAIMMDLEKVGLITCISLTRQSDKYIYTNFRRTNCETSKIGIDGFEVDNLIKAGNGEDWRVSFKTVNSQSLYSTMWILRLTAIMMGFAIYLLLRTQETVHLQEQAAEILRYQEVDYLAKQVAHDIRSPLSTLRIISSNLSGISEQERALILGACVRITDVANDLLERARLRLKPITSEQKNIKKSVIMAEGRMISVAAVVREIIKEKKILYGESGKVRIDFDLDAHARAVIVGNDMTLCRVLSNLINNSVEAMDKERGEVLVSVREYRDTVELSVKDNGRGIPQEVLSRLGDSIVTYGKDNAEGGNGLGIYHAKKSVMEMAGRMSIISSVGVGTIIQLVFPKAVAD